MSTARSFQDLTAAMNASRMPTTERRATPNPRIAAGMTSEQWDRKRRRERRAEWEATMRAATMNGPPVRDLKKFVPFEDAMLARLRDESCLDRRIPLHVDTSQPFPQVGLSVGAYFARKMKRLGTLGQHEALNPFWEAIREDARHAN